MGEVQHIIIVRVGVMASELVQVVQVPELDELAVVHHRVVMLVHRKKEVEQVVHQLVKEERWAEHVVALVSSEVQHGLERIEVSLKFSFVKIGLSSQS